MTGPRRGSDGARGSRGSQGGRSAGKPAGFRSGGGRSGGPHGAGADRTPRADGDREQGPRRDGHKNTPSRDERPARQPGRSVTGGSSAQRPPRQDARPHGERAQRPESPRAGAGSWQDRRPQGDRPQRSSGPREGGASWQDRRSQGDRPRRSSGPREGGGSWQDRRSQGDRPTGDRPQWQDRRPQGDRPTGDRPQWQDRRPQGDRPTGDRPQWQDRRPQGDRPTGDRPQWQDRRPQGDRPTGDRTEASGSRNGRGSWQERAERGGSAGDRPQWQDRRPQGDRPQRSGAGARDRRPSDGRREGRPAGRPTRDGEERRPPLPPGPDLPEWADPRELDQSVRVALRGLDPRNADKVAAHLVAAGTLLDEDPETSLAHARAARDRASRVAAVREAVGVAAYYAGDYAEAAREIRAYRRMSGDASYRAVLADCERAQGRPDVALRLVSEGLAENPDPEETVELRIVEAGARLDLDEASAARLVLEGALGGRPDPGSLDAGDPLRLRLASAYADLLEAEGEAGLATEWLTAIAAADPDNLTGAVDRLGIEFTDLADDELDEEDLDDLPEGGDVAGADAEGDEAEDGDAAAAPPETVEELPEDDHGL